MYCQTNKHCSKRNSWFQLFEALQSLSSKAWIGVGDTAFFKKMNIFFKEYSGFKKTTIFWMNLLDFLKNEYLFWMNILCRFLKKWFFVLNSGFSSDWILNWISFSTNSMKKLMFKTNQPLLPKRDNNVLYKRRLLRTISVLTPSNISLTPFCFLNSMPKVPKYGNFS